MIGRRLLHFEILEKLGEGGMGVVYKARDTHLDRLVALKVLPPEKVADPERRGRFVQEAKAASALHHPNIITVHDVAQADGLDFIVMEHVDGKTLDAMIPRGGMRLSEALKVASQIARALAAAHAKGIIHRDLKPANVMVATDGTVKVLDFGLAKLREAAAPLPDTETRAAVARTGDGVILGTAAYMSPEQAEGKPVDARSDVFSFGTLLYELVSGRQPFRGDSTVSTLSAVLREDPKPLEGLPPELERVILRCLRKDMEKRFQHMDDVSVALEELKEESDSGKLGAVAKAAPRSSRTRRLAFAAAGAVLLLAVAALVWRWGVPREPVTPPRLVPLTTFPGFEGQPAFSPDGKQVAFAWNGPKEDNLDIYVMLLGTSAPVRLTTNAANDFNPAWSPDGRWIAFQRWGNPPSVMLMSALGGSERELAKGSTRRGGLSWSPDGKYVAFPAGPETEGPARIELLSPDTGERRVATIPSASGQGDGMPRFSPDGKSLAFLRDVRAGYLGIGVVPADGPASSGRIVTPATARVWGVPFAWTRDGRELVFSASYDGTLYTMWRMAADGGRPPVRVAEAGDVAQDSAIAPQGDMLAFRRSLGEVNIWRLDLADGKPASDPVKLITSTSEDCSPDYSPDGQRIAFASIRSGTYEIWTCNADGSNPTRVSSLDAPMSGSPKWSPDGRTIAFDSNLSGDEEIYTVSADGGPAKRLTSHPGNDVVPTWSRDGRWIYFTSDRSGSPQIWKMPAGGGDPVQVTRGGGMNAMESADGRTVYFAKNVGGASLWKMPIGGGEETPVRDAAAGAAWGQMALTEGGIYFIARDGTDRPVRYAIFFSDFASRKTTRIYRLAKVLNTANPGLALSPDGRALLFTQIDASGSNLMLLEHFR